MIVRTYGRRSNSNSRSSNSASNNSLNFSDTEESLSQDLNLNQDFQNFAFTSQESVKNTQFDPFESDPFSFDEDTSRSKRPKIELGDKKGKKVVTSLIETTTLMETQECGEMMEHVDEVNFGLDGLRRGQPVRVRRSSLLSLLNVCGTLQQRRLLRTHG